jgi:hypothetical protein
VSERRDIAPGPILVVAGGVVLLMLFTLVTMRWLLDRLEHEQTAARPPAHVLAVDETARLPPPPRLQEHPIDDLLALRARENAALDGYAWVDPAAGRVRIPITRAMELVADGATP